MATISHHTTLSQWLLTNKFPLSHETPKLHRRLQLVPLTQHEVVLDAPRFRAFRSRIEIDTVIECVVEIVINEVRALEEQKDVEGGGATQ